MCTNEMVTGSIQQLVYGLLRVLKLLTVLSYTYRLSHDCKHCGIFKINNDHLAILLGFSALHVTLYDASLTVVHSKELYPWEHHNDQRWSCDLVDHMG